MRHLILLLLLVSVIGCKSEPPPPPKIEMVTLAVPEELFNWAQNITLNFQSSLEDGSQLKPQIEVLSWLDALREIPTGIKKPDIWISPHPSLLNAANRRVKSLGVSFEQCTPLFESKLNLVGHKKDIAALQSSESVKKIMLSDSTFLIPTPEISTTGFLASIPSGFTRLSYPHFIIPYSFIHEGTYAIAPEFQSLAGLIPLQFDATQSGFPSLKYQLCLSQGGLRRKQQIIGAKELYHHILSANSSNTPPSGFSKIDSIENDNFSDDAIEFLINNPKSQVQKLSKTVVFDNSGSIIDRGFGDGQRLAISIINSLGDGDHLTIKATSGNHPAFPLVGAKKSDGINFIQDLKPQGVGNFKDILKEELLSIQLSHKYSQLIVITDGDTIETNNTLLSWLEPISKNKHAQVLIFFTSETPLFNTIRDFKIPGVLVVESKDLQTWIDNI